MFNKFVSTVFGQPSEIAALTRCGDQVGFDGSVEVDVAGDVDSIVDLDLVLPLTFLEEDCSNWPAGPGARSTMESMSTSPFTSTVFDNDNVNVSFSERA